MFENALTQRIAEFLHSIGIRVYTGSVPDDTVLPGISIRNGELVIEEKKLLYPGDLLHEAGHLAVVTAAERPTLSDNVKRDLPEHQSAGEEIAAIAWSYAAALAIGIEASVVFHNEGYHGGAQSLLQNFETGRYLGVPLLQWYGLTHDPAQSQANNTEPYPHMVKWLR